MFIMMEINLLTWSKVINLKKSRCPSKKEKWKSMHQPLHIIFWHHSFSILHKMATLQYLTTIINWFLAEWHSLPSSAISASVCPCSSRNIDIHDVCFAPLLLFVQGDVNFLFASALHDLSSCFELILCCLTIFPFLSSSPFLSSLPSGIILPPLNIFLSVKTNIIMSFNFSFEWQWESYCHLLSYTGYYLQHEL